MNPAGRRFTCSPTRGSAARWQIKDAATAEATHINVVVNWFEELKRRVPLPR